MELRSRRQISNPPIDEASNVQVQNISDDSSDEAGSDSTVYVPSSSDHSDEDVDEEDSSRVEFDLNATPKAAVEVHDWEDNGYDYGKPSTKRKKAGQEKKTVEHGESSRAVDVDAQQAAVEIDFLGLAKNDNNNTIIYNFNNNNSNSNKKRKRKGGPKPRLLWNEWEEEHEKWIDENLTKDFDLECQDQEITETAEEPSELIMPLLRYQKEWLAWASKQEEKSGIRGGILADEMGMGKTIQAISLVLARREIRRTTDDDSSVLPGSSKGLPGIKATLVICPVVAVKQWESEIKRFTSEGCAKVLIYHGANRAKHSKEIRKCDFVLTTYSVVEAEFRKYMMPPKTKCPYCGKAYYESKLTIHLKYFCGPDAVRTEKQSKQARKKWSPAMSKQKTDSAEDVMDESDGKKSKGARRKASKQHNEEEDMGMGSRFGNEGVDSSSRGKSLLHAVKWERVILDEVILVIRELTLHSQKCDHCFDSENFESDNYILNLDKIFPCLMTPWRSNAQSSLYGVNNNGPNYYWRECSPSLFDFMIEAINLGFPGFTLHAHYIKARHCNTAKAVLALDSSYKWALSGTPLQNRVGELYSLVRFLQITPYSYYLCKDCDCKTLDHSSLKECQNCHHSSVRHFCWWNKYVATPIQSYGKSDEGRRAMILLKHKILKNIVLRRTKKGRAADLALPSRVVLLRRDTLDIKEQDYYESLYNDSQSQFNTYVQSGTVMNNYAHIFDLLTRLRQAVDHPYLVVCSRTAALRRENMISNDNGEQVCGICHDPAEDPAVTSCEHVFCKACLLNYCASFGQASCPSCSKLLTVDLTKNVDNGDQTSKTTIKGFRSSSILNRIQLDDFQTSTKIEALREEIRFMVERDGSAKGIVFSQFTSFLDLINYSLHKSGIKCVQLVGSMTMSARDASIKRFTEDPDCRIFLMSLKAGGVALNLAVASHVFLMDPWWNPAVERQAQDRIHRIGQYKPIRIVRFVIENTIEERILKLQEKKELVFEGTIGGSTEALGKLTEEDLRFLFVT